MDSSNVYADRDEIFFQHLGLADLQFVTNAVEEVLCILGNPRRPKRLSKSRHQVAFLGRGTTGSEGMGIYLSPSRFSR